MFLWKGLWLFRMAPLNKPDTADGSFYNFIRQAHSEKYLDRWLYKAFICNCIPQASTNQRAPPAATEAFTLSSSVTSKPQAKFICHDHSLSQTKYAMDYMRKESENIAAINPIWGFALVHQETSPHVHVCPTRLWRVILSDI